MRLFQLLKISSIYLLLTNFIHLFISESEPIHRYRKGVISIISHSPGMQMIHKDYTWFHSLIINSIQPHDLYYTSKIQRSKVWDSGWQDTTEVNQKTILTQPSALAGWRMNEQRGCALTHQVITGAFHQDKGWGTQHMTCSDLSDRRNKGKDIMNDIEKILIWLWKSSISLKIHFAILANSQMWHPEVTERIKLQR